MSGIKNHIRFEQSGLGEVLKLHRLVLPPNQREYAWEERHVRQLLEDFAKAVIDDGKGYFLGTLVTIPKDDGILQVVDGQQRLATTSLLLAAIRDYLLGKDERVVETISTRYLAGYDLKARCDVPRLTLNIDDNDLFLALVTNAKKTIPPATRDSHRRLINAYKTAETQVRNIVALHAPKDHVDILLKWVTFIEERALAILVQVADGANAYKMFETLNDRGLKTSQADLIKSFLFEKANRRVAEVQARWSRIRGALETLGEKDNTVSFLRYALIVQRGKVKEEAVYENVQQLARNEDEAVTCAANLEELANSYVAIFNQDHEKWNGYPDAVKRSIEVFPLLATKPLRPLILAIASKFDPKETTSAFKFMVSLSARLTLSGGSTSGSVDELAASVSVDIFSKKITTKAALKLALANITPTDEHFIEAVSVAKVSQARLSRYYLRSLEMAHKDEAEPYFIPNDDRQAISLEHILPKSRMGCWPQFSEEVADLWVNRLGNQLLMRTSENSGAKSCAFLDKKSLYAQSTYETTKPVAEFSDWTTASIEKRQKALARLAVKTWPL